MGHRVQAPGVVGGEIQPGPAGALGLAVSAVFLQREGHAAHGIARMGVRRAVMLDHRANRAQHPAPVAQHEADGVHQLHRQGVFRMPNQHCVQHHRRLRRPPGEIGGERPEVAFLAPGRPRGGDGRPALVQRLGRHRRQFRAPQQQGEHPLRGPAQRELRRAPERLGQVLRRAGGMRQEARDRTFPGRPRLMILQGHGQTVDVEHGHCRHPCGCRPGRRRAFCCRPGASGHLNGIRCPQCCVKPTPVHPVVTAGDGKTRSETVKPDESGRA